MSELNRVSSAVSNFFDSDKSSNIEGLAEVVQHTVIDGYRRYMELQLEDEDLSKVFGDIQTAAVEAAKTPPPVEELPETFSSLLHRAVEARRATYDLTDPDRPWEKLTPAAAVASEDDMFTFPIVDTVVDKIEELINPADPSVEQVPPSPASPAVVEAYKKQEAKEAAERAEAIAKQLSQQSPDGEDAEDAPDEDTDDS